MWYEYRVCHLKRNTTFPPAYRPRITITMCDFAATCSQQRTFHSLASRSLSELSKQSVESVRVWKSTDAVYPQTTHLFTRVLPSNEIIRWHNRHVYRRVWRRTGPEQVVYLPACEKILWDEECDECTKEPNVHCVDTKKSGGNRCHFLRHPTLFDL